MGRRFLEGQRPPYPMDQGGAREGRGEFARQAAGALAYMRRALKALRGGQKNRR